LYSKYTQKNSYKLGFIIGLDVRLKEMRKQELVVEDEVICTALVVKDFVERELQKVKNYIDEEYPKLKELNQKVSDLDEHAHVRGIVASKNVSLNKQIGENK
jgi:hypothetical protein